MIMTMTMTMKNILTFLIIFMSTFMYSQTDSLAIIERQTYLDSFDSTSFNAKNATPVDAVEIDLCGTSFSTTSYGATAEGCGFYNQDLDCNSSTGSPSGADVGYSVENDIFYYFCPANQGSWEFTITPSNCDATKCNGNGPSSGGYQYAIFQGQSDSLHTLLDGGIGGQKICIFNTTTITINVTDTTECIYIQIDGYAGTECDYDITLENLTGDCVLPVELIQQGVYNEFQENIIYWITASETNSDYFQIESSRDGKNWRVLGYESGAGNTSQETLYNFVDSEYSKGINYYRIKQVDYDGEFEYFDIMSIDNKNNKNNNDRKLIKTINLLNQEVNEDYNGIVIDIYDNGDKIKRYNKK